VISLKQLRYLEALARHGHFGRAADACAVTQPALSMQIQELEAELGVELVERRRSGARLTEAGQEVARRGASILTEIRDLNDYAKHRRGGLTGGLHLGVIPSVAPYLLPPLLPAIRERYPALELHIRETQTRQLTQELLQGTLDLMLVALPIEDTEIETAALFEDRFVLALPEARRIESQVRATPDLIEHDRLLLLEEGHCMRDQALSFCSLRRIENIDTFGASSLTTLVQMVAAGLGLTLLPELSLGVEARDGRLKLMRFTDPEPSRTLGLAWRATSPRKADFARLGELIKETRPAVPEVA
jgi:LysR family transcriptional regulator, hydrogen peroxide-inducible genes activator